MDSGIMSYDPLEKPYQYDAVNPRAINTGDVIDGLLGPKLQTKAAMHLLQDVEQKLFNLRGFAAGQSTASDTKAVLEYCLDEIESYTYLLGEMLNSARNEIENLYQVASASTEGANKQ